MNKIPDTIIQYHWYPYLAFDDILNVSISCHHTWNTLIKHRKEGNGKTMMIDRIKALFSTAVILDEFIPLMKEANAVFSGGALLSILLHNTQFTDLDFFMWRKPTSILDSSLDNYLFQRARAASATYQCSYTNNTPLIINKQGFERPRFLLSYANVAQVYKELEEQYGFRIDDVYNYPLWLKKQVITNAELPQLSAVNLIDKIHLDLVPFQTIYLNIDPIYHILNHFDYDILQNYFDGSQLVIQNMWSIADKRITRTHHGEHQRTVGDKTKRDAKYKAKGFTFVEKRKLDISDDDESNNSSESISSSSSSFAKRQKTS